MGNVEEGMCLHLAIGLRHAVDILFFQDLPDSRYDGWEAEGDGEWKRRASIR